MIEKAIRDKLLTDNFEAFKQNSHLRQIHDLMNLEGLKKDEDTMDVDHVITDAMLRQDKRNEKKQERGGR